MAEHKKPSLIFIPRSVVQKNPPKKNTLCPSQHKLTNIEHSALTPEGSTRDHDDAHKSKSLHSVGTLVNHVKDEVCTRDDEVKQSSSQQRWPATDEPVCVVCEKYGEYICDQTDADVCSMECKKKHLQMIKHMPIAETGSSKTNIEDPTCEVEISFEEFYKEKVAWLPNGCIGSEVNLKLKEELNIRTKGDTVDLISSFDQCSFTSGLLENLQTHGFVHPTPIQMKVIPCILSGRDVMASACTSSGKTAAFLLPIIHHIHSCLSSLSRAHQFCHSPIAMVITPTRELAIQIEETAKEFAKGLNNVRTGLLIGGAPLPPQLHRLNAHVQLVIGTPGRISDVLENHRVLDLSQMKLVVLDEVDVMLTMGFQNQIMSIIEVIPTKPQFLMFSATIPPLIEKLAGTMMIEPVFIAVGEHGLPNNLIKQIIIWVEDVSKKKKLFSILSEQKYYSPPILVFVNSKLGADLLRDAISEKFSIQCESLHSDKTQVERINILANLMDGVYDVVVCTNVVARGIDIVNVNQVIVFDMPNNIEEYVHQIGRAGGHLTKGFAISFVNKLNKNIFVDLKDVSEACGLKLPEELIRSPHLTNELKKREQVSARKYKHSALKRRKDETITSQSLLQILTKNSKF